GDARVEVTVDLHRSVRTFAARRHEHVRLAEIGTERGHRPAPEEMHDLAEPELAASRTVLADVTVAAADDHELRPGMGFVEVCEALQQEPDALVALEIADVHHDRPFDAGVAAQVFHALHGRIRDEAHVLDDVHDAGREIPCLRREVLAYRDDGD